MNMVEPDSVITDERLERERDYHNQRFTEETREAQGKFYWAIADGATLFTKRVTELARGADVLEYGCARGDVSLDLAPLCRSITGIDISDIAVDAATHAARENGLSNTRFLTMNAEEMSFPNDSFDMIFGRGIIHHLDVERSFSEISRVLRPGGTALFWEPLGHNLFINAYRNATPGARTPDEHPLIKTDFDIAKRYFGDVSPSFWGLTSFLTIPVRDTPLGHRLLRMTAAVDRMLFAVPGFKWQAWYCLIELKGGQNVG